MHVSLQWRTHFYASQDIRLIFCVQMESMKSKATKSSETKKETFKMKKSERNDIDRLEVNNKQKRTKVMINVKNTLKR